MFDVCGLFLGAVDAEIMRPGLTRVHMDAQRPLADVIGTAACTELARAIDLVDRVGMHVVAVDGIAVVRGPAEARDDGLLLGHPDARRVIAGHGANPAALLVLDSPAVGVQVRHERSVVLIRHKARVEEFHHTGPHGKVLREGLAPEIGLSLFPVPLSRLLFDFDLDRSDLYLVLGHRLGLCARRIHDGGGDPPCRHGTAETITP